MPNRFAGHGELYKAYKRIGNSPRAWMQWLLRFGNCDLATLSAGGWMDLRYEVALFTLVGPPEAWKIGRTIASLMPWRPTDGSPSYYRFPNPEAVEMLQVWTHRHLDELLRTNRTEFPPLQATMGVSYDTELDLGVLAVSPETLQQSFLYGLARLLAIHGARIRRCSSCQAKLLATRRGQAFCSVRCQSRFNMRKYRRTPPERIGKRGRPPKKGRHLAKRT